MTPELIINATTTFVRETLVNAEGGHDWWHVYRVWQLSKQIAQTEDVDMLTVEIGALLHDIADSKFHNGDESLGPKKARVFLEGISIDQDIILHIEQIIANISYKGGKEKRIFSSLELDVIQDADRLDAMGAIGIARTFNYGGFKNRELYNPDISPNLKMTKEEYKSSTAPTLNHFYEKLLLLKELMNTTTGATIAKHRHQYMKGFLSEFYSEWNGEV